MERIDFHRDPNRNVKKKKEEEEMVVHALFVAVEYDHN